MPQLVEEVLQQLPMVLASLQVVVELKSCQVVRLLEVLAVEVSQLEGLLLSQTQGLEQLPEMVLVLAARV